MRVGVIISCYNSSATIEKTLRSVDAQTYKEFECIIIDDGSTDDTLSILQSFPFRPGIESRVVSRENKGFAFSLDEGVRLAQGDVIARIDADDLWEPTHLEMVCRAMEESGAVLVGSRATIIDGEDNVIGEYDCPTDNESIIRGLVYDNPMIHSSVVFSKEAYMQTTGYYHDDSEFFKHIADYHLWVELSFLGVCLNIPEKTIRYRYHEDSMSRRVDRATNYKARRYVMTKAYNHHRRYTPHFLWGLLRVTGRMIIS